jgi:hypothetical protein
VFLNYLDKPYLAYDIKPDDKRIVKQDFLTLDLPYKKGRCIIGNPPFGIRNTLSVKFYKHSLKFGDYIAFILPITQFNNNIQMYEFNLVHSEKVNNIKFHNLDKRVQLTFNIYKRPEHGYNQRPNYKLNDVSITEVRNGNKIVTNYDLRIMAWGGSLTGGNINIGHEVDYENQYAKEFCIKVNNPKYKDKVIDLIKSTDWRELYYMPSPPNLLQWQVYKYIKEQIPDIQ